MNQVDDQEIIAAVLEGDSEAYAIIVERYQKPIYNLMHRLTGSQEDALDLAQDTFMKAYQKLYQFRPDAKFFPWLYTIGANHAKNFLRRRQFTHDSGSQNLEQASTSDHASEEEDRMCAQLDGRRLWHAMQQLPEDYREAVVLRYHEDLTMEDIATALDLSISGAKMRVHRGLNKLRQILTQDSS